MFGKKNITESGANADECRMGKAENKIVKHPSTKSGSKHPKSEDLTLSSVEINNESTKDKSNVFFYA